RKVELPAKNKVTCSLSITPLSDVFEGYPKSLQMKLEPSAVAADIAGWDISHSGVVKVPVKDGPGELFDRSEHLTVNELLPKPFRSEYSSETWFDADANALRVVRRALQGDFV